ncbi:pitrilysin family protein [Fodinicola feengrottensis]|uniref:Pitrilysin family protein n=1 Tax=Fodinicola feengrottensis TaxID=435914 RepID=A0ABN2IIH7_9ACTN
MIAPARRGSSRPVTVKPVSYPVERLTLANGLRVVLAPDRSAPVVAVALTYDVGIRSEPEGRTGFAHLFEHLMFQGSENLEKLEHFRHVQASGGVFNGSTHLDYTDYYELMPSAALERALFLEADRMRGPRLTEENLTNQISVVKEEIRVNVLNRPYGGFPWLKLPPVLFDTFANAHDGYGAFVDLESATVADAAEFFDRYYAPSNAVLAVAGDFDVAHGAVLVERHFGAIVGRETPVRPDFDEPDLTSERRQSYADPHAPMPALAAAWRVPDPIGSLSEYLPYVVLGEVLTDGEASRLVQRMVHDDRLATSVSAYCGLMGDPFDVRNPTAMILQVHSPPGVAADTVLSTMDSELDRLATDGLSAAELNRIQARLAAQLLREADPVLSRTLAMTVFEQQRGEAELVGKLPTMVTEVTADQVVAAAAALAPNRRAVVEVHPGGAQ